MINNALRARPKLATVLAVAAVCAGLLLGLGSKAIAATYFNTYTFGPSANGGTVGEPNSRDSDGRVNEYYGCAFACNDGMVGETKTIRKNYRVYRYIIYDRATMCSFHADQADWDRLFRHERAHSRGWSHYEGNDYANSAYHPSIGDVGGGPGC